MESSYISARVPDSLVHEFGILARAVGRANDGLEERGLAPLPEGLTPHSMRRTFASLLVALGEDPMSVMEQVGHTDPKFTLRVYASVMRRRDGERDHLRALVGREGETRPSTRAATSTANVT